MTRIVFVIIFYFVLVSIGYCISLTNQISYINKPDTLVDSCDSILCPLGWKCIPGTDQCGIPVGDGCYDIESEWWTGLNVEKEDSDQHDSVVFIITNMNDYPLYFMATVHGTIVYNIYTDNDGIGRKLELEVNHFCPTMCPEIGRPMIIDCGKPPRIVQCIPVNQTARVRWSGSEQVGTIRLCDTTRFHYCMTNYKTMPGSYYIEFCGFEDISGGKINTDNLNQWIGAKLIGESRCAEVRFNFPTLAVIEIVFKK